MRVPVLAALLSWSCASTEPAPVPPPTGFVWCADLADAQDLARTDRRPVAAFFMYESCHWCRVLAHETLPDPAVVARSRAFHWVQVNRDRDPELAERFRVAAYPSILVLGPANENLHRFEGFRKPTELVLELDEALARHGRFTRGQDWDIPSPRLPRICDTGTVTTLPAPSTEVPSGIVALDGCLWAAYRTELFKLAAADGAVLAGHVLTEPINGLCTDGSSLYGVELGWTMGRPIHVIDPASGRVVRTITTEANAGEKTATAYGIAWADGALHVLAGQGEIHRLAPDGKVERTLKTPLSYVMGLCFDGERFVCGGREGLHFVDPRTGKVTRQVDTNYPVRALGWDGKALLLLEQPVFGFGRQHERITVWPKVGLVHRLQL